MPIKHKVKPLCEERPERCSGAKTEQNIEFVKPAQITVAAKITNMNKIDQIIDLFFDNNPNLPEKYKNLQAQYNADKQSLGTCSSCQLNSLREHYKRKLLNFE